MREGVPFFSDFTWFVFFLEGGNIKVKETLSIHVCAYHCYFIQEPSKCPLFMCLMHCEHGFVVDENGCETCKCAEVIYFCCYIFHSHAPVKKCESEGCQNQAFPHNREYSGV